MLKVSRRAATALAALTLSGGAVFATTAPAAAATPAPAAAPLGFTQPTADTAWRVGSTLRIAWNTSIGPPEGGIELMSGPVNARESSGVLVTANLSAPGSVDIAIPAGTRPSDTYALRSGTYESPLFSILKQIR